MTTALTPAPTAPGASLRHYGETTVQASASGHEIVVMRDGTAITVTFAPHRVTAVHIAQDEENVASLQLYRDRVKAVACYLSREFTFHLECLKTHIGTVRGGTVSPR